MVASLSFRGPHLERRRDDKLPTSRDMKMIFADSCCTGKYNSTISQPRLSYIWPSSGAIVDISSGVYLTITPVSEEIFPQRGEGLWHHPLSLKLASSRCYTIALTHLNTRRSRLPWFLIKSSSRNKALQPLRKCWVKSRGRASLCWHLQGTEIPCKTRTALVPVKFQRTLWLFINIPLHNNRFVDSLKTLCTTLMH